MYKLLFRVIVMFSFFLFAEFSAFTIDKEASIHKSVTEDIVKFTVTPENLKLFPGGSMQLTATAYNSKGEKVTVSPLRVIKRDVSSFGEFDKDKGERVIFNAVSSGTGYIIVTYNDFEAEIPVKIFKTKRKKR